MNKVDGRSFVDNKKEVKGPRQGNSYDCGIYVILMMEKIIKNVKEGRNIEIMKINQEEADRKRSKIRERLKEENTIVNENEKNVKKQREIDENEEYFTKLNLKILNYSKLDTITLDNEIVKENGKEEKIKIEIKKIYEMTNKLLTRRKGDNSNKIKEKITKSISMDTVNMGNKQILNKGKKTNTIAESEVKTFCLANA